MTRLKIYFSYIIIFNFYISFYNGSSGENHAFLSLERVIVSFYDKRYISDFAAWTKRHSRNDPVHYYNLNITTSAYVGNNVTANIYVYEYLSNVYKPSFVEMHFELCDFVPKFIQFFGVTLKLDGPKLVCPFVPGTYTLRNTSLVPPQRIVDSFPFRKGRIIFNGTITKTKVVVFSSHVDMELKFLKTS